MTLKVKIVSTSVRTAACAHSQRTPSAMSSRTDGRARRVGAAARAADPGDAAAPEQRRTTAWATNGSAIPAANSAAPTGGPASWLHSDEPGLQPGVARCRGRRGPRASAAAWRGGVAEDLGRAEQEQRDQNHRDVDRPVTIDARARRAPRRAAGRRRRRCASVEPVGEHAGVQAEQQPGQPLQERGQRHQPAGRAFATPPAAGRRRA